MRFKHTNRPGFWMGFIDFFTAGLFFLLYMPLGGLQDELDEILGRRTQRYWAAYLLGIPTAFIYPLVWMARIAEELKAKAIDLGIEGPYTSWWHMFGWNTFGLPLMGPAVATWRFFKTLNGIEKKLNEMKDTLYTIRKAEPRDLEAVNGLLQQVLSVHNRARPDLFNEIGKKYTDEELISIFNNPETPVFVYDREGAVLGYAFCVLRHHGSGSLRQISSLYIDDLCVHEKARGQHIGRVLFEYAKSFAKEQGCHNITLHVWEGNPGARAFYESLGLKPQYISMEMLCK